MLTISLLNAYTKNLKMQMQLDMKQANGELGSHKALKDYLDPAQTPSQDDEDTQKDKLRSIKFKLYNGGKLSESERKYLQQKDPGAYSKLQQSEQEQKAYEARLRQCRTKEEAQRLRMAYLGTSMARLKEVEHDSSISSERKLEIFAQEKQRCDMIAKSSHEFVRRGDYNALPTDAEAAKARRDARKAKRPQKDRLDKDTKPQEKSGRYERRKPKIHIETPEERKVKRAKARARASAVSDYGKAMAAYMAASRAASSGKEEAAIVGKAEASMDVKG